MGTVATNLPFMELLSPAQSSEVGQHVSPGKQRHRAELMAGEVIVTIENMRMPTTKLEAFGDMMFRGSVDATTNLKCGRTKDRVSTRLGTKLVSSNGSTRQ